MMDKGNFTNVFVKNFCESTTEDDLKNIFCEFGLITSTVVMRNEDGTPKCFGFVNFVNAEDASRAVESLNGRIFDDKKLYVGRAQKKNERQLELKHHLECVKEAFDKGSNLYVKNLDASIDDEKLKELFSPFGSVKSCGVMRDKKGICTGRGLVAFSSPEEASRARSEMNGKVLVGKPLYVAIAQRKKDRIAHLKNFDKEIDHKALDETFSSSGKVATVASGQSIGHGFLQFTGMESAQKAIGKLNAIVMKLSDFIGQLNGIIRELNGIIDEFNTMQFNGTQVYIEPFLSKQENKLFVYKANSTDVFVKNFCESMTEDDLKNIFGEFGKITSTKVMRNEDGTSKGFGFVNFENVDDATRAVESLNGHEFDEKKWRSKFEREMELKKSLKQSVKEAVDKGSNLYVGNLDYSIDNEKLKELFSPFGLVTSCKVMQDQKGISVGSGFVAFSSPEEASRAISEMNGKTLASKPLYVGLARRKEERRAQLQNLKKEIDHKALLESLSSFQDTLSSKVATDASGQSMGWGFVQFGDEEYVQETVGKHNGMPLNEKQTCVGSLLSKQERELSTDNAKFTDVLVKNFCESTTEDDLKNIFGKFGSVTNAVVVRNEDVTSKCFGFVSFKNTEDAARAVESLNGQKFDKKRCYVGRAQKDLRGELELKHHHPSPCVKGTVDKGHNVCVSNLDGCIGDKKLSELFPPIRSVTSCKVVRDLKGISRGRGLVGLSPRGEASEIPGYGYQEIVVPGMTPAGPCMPNMYMPLVQQKQQGSLHGGGHNNSSPMQKGTLPAPAMPEQMLPRECGYCYPPGGFFSVNHKMGGLPLHAAGMSWPIPVGSLASSLANAAPLNRGLVKFCTRLLKWNLR